MARAPTRRVPASAGRFSVDLGSGNAGNDIRQVVLPRFPASKEGGPQGPLQLRRTASDDRLFHDWWAETLAGKATARTVTVSLLAPDLAAALVTWRFLKARPLALSYGALDGAVDLPLEEVLELAFEKMERA